MRIHAGTLGTLPREVGRSLSGYDQVFLPGKKKKKFVLTLVCQTLSRLSTCSLFLQLLKAFF